MQARNSHRKQGTRSKFLQVLRFLALLAICTICILGGFLLQSEVIVQGFRFFQHAPHLEEFYGLQFDLTENAEHPESSRTASGPPKNISLAQFTSAAKHLVITRARTPWWGPKTGDWWTTFHGANASFLSIRGCRVPEIEGDVDMLVLEQTPGEEFISVLNFTEIQMNTDIQEVRIVDVYHSYDTFEDEDIVVPNTDGMLQMRLLASFEAGFFSKGAYDPEFRGQFHMFATSQYSPDAIDPKSPVWYRPDVFNQLDWFRSPTVDFASKRNVSALFVQRNCGSPLKREEFVKALREHMAIDCPGKCLHNLDDPELPARSKGARIPSDFYSKYKFGFAIENQLCRGYITEKLPAAVDAGVVPIVMTYRDPDTGEQFPSIDDYVPSDETHFPNQSYIDLAQFSNAKEAADFLREVANNETLYNSYLWTRFLPQDRKEELIAELQARTAVKDFIVDTGVGYTCSLASKIIHHDTRTRLEPMSEDECQTEQSRKW